MRTPSRSQTHLKSEGRIAAIARAQHGVFNAEQAIDAGFTRAQIRYRVQTGRWEALNSGVYRPFGSAPTWEQRLMAACLATGGVASHRSAGVLWGLPGCARDVVEITATRHRRQQRGGVVCHESYLLGPNATTHIHDVPVTTIHRTIVDLASVLPSVPLEQAIDDAVRRSRTSPARLREELDRLGPKRRGFRRMDRVLGLRFDWGSSESPLETRFRQLLRDGGVTEPVYQQEVELGSGRVARVDCAFVDRKLAIELDGAATHTSRVDRQRDLLRQNGLILAGWRVLRFTWEDVHDRPDGTIRVLRLALHTPA